jgi:hypothetical protein
MIHHSCNIQPEWIIETNQIHLDRSHYITVAIISGYANFYPIYRNVLVVAVVVVLLIGGSSKQFTNLTYFTNLKDSAAETWIWDQNLQARNITSAS